MPHIETILRHVDELPTLAPVAARLLALSSADDADFDEIIRLIEADPTLTGRLLSLCRRAGTGAAQPVSTVRRAVVLLGLEALQAAILSVQVVELMRRPPGSEQQGQQPGPLAEGFNAEGFWRHALAVACAAELLAQHHRELKINPGEAFTAGLLHDIGKLALAWVLPRSYPGVLALAAARRSDLAPIETDLLGIDHHIVGKRLAEHWGLPHTLLDPIWLHAADDASIASVKRPDLVHLVAAANTLARTLHIGWSGSCGPLPDRALLLAAAKLNPARVADVEALLHAAVAQRCSDLGLGEHSGPALVIESIAAANSRLAQLHRAAAARSASADLHARVLAGVASFAETFAAGPDEVLTRLAAALESIAGTGELLAIHQPRADAPWTLTRIGQAGRTIASATLAAPCPELRTLATNGSLGDAATLAGFLTAHLPPALADINIRALRPLWLAAPGIGALLLHDRPLPQPPPGHTGADGHTLLAPLVAVASAALLASSHAEGARRLGERLAAANAELARAQSARSQRESMARLGELTAGAAHEMNNPLTVISAKAQALLARLSLNKDRDDATAIAQASHALSDLVSKLHLLAKPPLPAPAPCRLSDCLAEAVRLGRAGASITPRPQMRSGSRNGAPASKATADVSIVVRPPGAELRTDSALLARALAEVIANALEAPPAPGHAPAGVRVQASLESERVVITVTDGGAGLSTLALRHAFDPFFSEKAAGRQTGLGLPICRALVHALGGDISLARSDKGGCCAELLLPLAHGPAAAPANAQPLPIPALQARSRAA
ncbi:MAG: HDOD domain-containing protein [Phycisphaerales bacterium]